MNVSGYPEFAQMDAQFVYGGSFVGDSSAGPIDMSAATYGVYDPDNGPGKWHRKISTNTYAWLLIAGALALLVLSGAVVFREVNA